jgi:hypothetical protein
MGSTAEGLIWAEQPQTDQLRERNLTEIQSPIMNLASAKAGQQMNDDLKLLVHNKRSKE